MAIGHVTVRSQETRRWRTMLQNSACWHSKAKTQAETISTERKKKNLYQKCRRAHVTSLDGPAKKRLPNSQAISCLPLTMLNCILQASRQKWSAVASPQKPEKAECFVRHTSKMEGLSKKRRRSIAWECRVGMRCRVSLQQPISLGRLVLPSLLDAEEDLLHMF